MIAYSSFGEQEARGDLCQAGHEEGSREDLAFAVGQWIGAFAQSTRILLLLPAKLVCPCLSALLNGPRNWGFRSKRLRNCSPCASILRYLPSRSNAGLKQSWWRSSGK